MRYLKILLDALPGTVWKLAVSLGKAPDRITYKGG